ncbi:PKD domain-containing protein [Nocardioides sp. Root190]|uniref:PKD domain-containing protein n=1 Tax=Nocardioides sp. Root190 TaxID=1736488 RepID=UPI0012FAD173|nr:PKD domain-containing protein [Nocardioides sp. Root190]
MVSRLPVLLLLLLGLVAVVPVLASAEPEPRTWVIDAVDDENGNRWVAEDTGTQVLTVRVGDTVEWQFDRAVIEHDLTSEDSRSEWAEPVQEYRVPGGDAVRRTFATAGTYEYLCSLHGVVMRGTVVVEDAVNAAPTGTASATPTSGAAPLEVHFSAEVTDADGDPLSYTWDVGTGEAPDSVDGAHATHTYTEAGTWTATLEVSDGNGGVFRQEFPIVVGEVEDELPTVHAHADHTAGPSPLPVALSTSVTTDGTFHSYADGLTTYPELTGTASLVRSRGQTWAALDVTGLRANAAHLVHVHEQACGSAHGGAHFRFDETQPFAEDNEVWLPFTSDATGTTGTVAVTQPLRAGAKAVSIVIHDPDNPAKRIGCADLGPGTADLGYTWSFGDGADGSGPDPDHVYTAPGVHTATVTVTAPGGKQTTASVEITVGVPADVTPPQTRITAGPSGTVRTRTASFRFGSDEPGSRFLCRVDSRAWTGCRPAASLTGLRDGPHRLLVRAVDPSGNVDPTPAHRSWTVDSRGPAVDLIGPTGPVRDRTPTVRARVRDIPSPVRARGIVLRVDGRLVAIRYDARRGVVTWQPRRALAPGRHRVRLVVADSVGNRTVRTWSFRVR